MDDLKEKEAKTQDATASKLKRIVIWLKCLFIGHDWLYDAEKPINNEWHRECRRCEKRQHKEYNKDGFPAGWQNGW